MTWSLFWAGFVLVSLVAYALLVVWAGFQGWRDLRHLLGRRRSEGSGEDTPGPRVGP